MIYALLLLVPSIICIHWSVMFFKRWRTNFRAQNVIAVNIAISAMSVMFFVDYFVDIDGLWTWRYIQNIIYTFGTLAPLPLYIRYYRLLTNADKLKWWNNIIFLPAIVATLCTLICYIIMGHEQAVYYIKYVVYKMNGGRQITSDMIELQNLRSIILTYFVLPLQAMYLLVYALIALKKYRKKLSDFYSNLRGKNLRTNYALLALITCCYVIITISTTMPYIIYENQLVLVMFIIGFATTMFLIAKLVYGLKFCASELENFQKKANAQALKYNLPQDFDMATDTDNKPPILFPLSMRREFTALIDDKKLFLQPDLSIADLATQLSANTTYLSEMIRAEFAMNFFEFINTKRIEYAIVLMSMSPELPVDKVAHKTGYLSQAAFYKSFKKTTGLSPNEWKSGVVDELN